MLAVDSLLWRSKRNSLDTMFVMAPNANAILAYQSIFNQEQIAGEHQSGF